MKQPREREWEIVSEKMQEWRVRAGLEILDTLWASP